HGGVILSSRKLNYDNGSAEEAVKALMQAQHKAVLKDLKAGSFDAKIDEYLGGTPGLEPAPRRQRRDTLVTPPPPSVDPDPQVTPPAGSSLSEALLTRVTAEMGPTVPAGRGAESTPPPAPPARSRRGGAGRGDDAPAAFAPISTDAAPRTRGAVPSPHADQAETTPAPATTDHQAPAARAATPPPIPAAAGKPRGDRNREPSGEYSQHRAGRADAIPSVHDQPTAPVQRARDREAARGS